MQPLELSHEGFKAYDIRGVVGAEVNEDLAYRVGRAYAALYHPQVMCVGYDIRPSSPAIAEAVMRLGSKEIYRLAALSLAGRWMSFPVGGFLWEPF